MDILTIPGLIKRFFFLLFCLHSSGLQEDVCAEAEGTTETIWQARKKTEGAESWWQVHQAGCEYCCPPQGLKCGPKTKWTRLWRENQSWQFEVIHLKKHTKTTVEEAIVSWMHTFHMLSLYLTQFLKNIYFQEKQTKEALTRKQQKGKKKGGQEEESQEATELLKRPREYTVKFTFPDPPPLSPPILGLHSKNICFQLHQLSARNDTETLVAVQGTTNCSKHETIFNTVVTI